MSAREYYEEYWGRSHPPPLDDRLAPTRSRLLWQLAEEAGLRGRFLEVGCGAGDLVAEAQRRGFDALGMDIASRAVELAKERHPNCHFLVQAAEERPWPIAPGSVDLIASFEVIEHLLRPAELVKGAYEALRPGGRLALTTPYHGPLKNVAIALVGFDRHFAAEGDHIRFFSDAALRRILENNGFAVERVRHYGRIWGLWAGVFVWARRQ